MMMMLITTTVVVVVRVAHQFSLGDGDAADADDDAMGDAHAGRLV